MTFSLNDLKSEFEQAKAAGATHMIVSYDDFDYENYTILVMPGEDPHEKVPDNGDRIEEVYKISLGWLAQSKYGRVMNW